MADAIQKKDAGALTNSGVSALLEANKEELAKILPRHLTMERLLKVVLYTVHSNPDLLKCTQASLLSCIKQCVELGLEPGGTRGLAYFIPFRVGQSDLGRTCTLIIGYKGLVQLAKRSGSVLDIEARVVFKNDVFQYEFGLTPRLRHVPSLDKPGAPVAVYCIARLRGGATHVEVMSEAEVMAIKAKSKGASKADSPWNSKPGPDADRFNEFQMWRKTAIRRSANYLDLSPEVNEAFALDDDADSRVAEIELTPPPAPKKAAKSMAASTTSDAEVIEEPRAETVLTREQISEIREAVGLKKVNPENVKPREPGSDEVVIAATPETPSLQKPAEGTHMHADWLLSRFKEATTNEQLLELSVDSTAVPAEKKSAINAAYGEAKKRIRDAAAGKRDA